MKLDGYTRLAAVVANPIKHSISHSQILLRNYTYEEAYVPMREW